MTIWYGDLMRRPGIEAVRLSARRSERSSVPFHDAMLNFYVLIKQVAVDGIDRQAEWQAEAPNGGSSSGLFTGWLTITPARAKEILGKAKEEREKYAAALASDEAAIALCLEGGWYKSGTNYDEVFGKPEYADVERLRVYCERRLSQHESQNEVFDSLFTGFIEGCNYGASRHADPAKNRRVRGYRMITPHPQ